MSKPATQEDGPKFDRPTRIRVALAKYHGLDGEEWSKDQIAEFLNVERNTVTKYLNDSDLAQETSGTMVEKEAQTRFQIIQQLKDKLDRLEKIEEKISQEAEVVPTQYKMERNVRAEVDFSDVPNVQTPDEGVQKVEVDLPVPDRYEEMPNLDKMEKVWREKRLVQEQLEDLLGLESPDEIDVSEEKTIDVKYWRTDDDLPEQEVIDVSGGPVEDELPEPEQEEVDDEQS